ncbi:MAG: hypothetical protein H6667_25245 [Ardenticatenaceae bacterium]|nr:hypothetical protein [Ardenticatenaceae bacterium]
MGAEPEGTAVFHPRRPRVKLPGTAVTFWIAHCLAHRRKGIVGLGGRRSGRNGRPANHRAFCGTRCSDFACLDFEFGRFGLLVTAVGSPLAQQVGFGYEAQVVILA